MTETALLSLFGFILTAHAIQHQEVRLNGMAVLSCGDLKAGKVTWSRYVNGSQVFILSTNDGQITRHMKNNNYSTLSDLSLIIWFVSPLDEGLYYCNGSSVACLTVKTGLTADSPEDLTTCLTGAVSVMERVLMFSGVGLAALTFLMATAAAVWKIKHSVYETDDKQTLQTELDYINQTSLY